MFRTALLLSLITSLAVLLPLQGQERADLAEIRTLERALRQIIKDAEPGMASVLVSRSAAYADFKAMPSPGEPGRLGAFDAEGERRQTPRLNQTRLDLINRLDLSQPDHVPESYGSGVVLDAGGLVLTPYHVVREATKVYVRLPGKGGSYADIHAADPRSDLAVLKLLNPPAKLQALSLGRGEDAEKGQFVVALTNTFTAGFRDDGPSASWGIISAVRQKAGAGEQEEERTRSLHHYGTLLLADVRMNLGCSGGALLNLKGEVIGLTSALAGLAGIEPPGAFAIPMNAGMRRIVDRLKQGKEVEYGFLGVRYNPNVARGNGISILGVTPNSPAWNAGLRGGMTITKIDGMTIDDPDDLFLAIGSALAGSQITLEALTPGGRIEKFMPVLSKFYVPTPFIASNRPPAVGGVRVDYTSTLIRGGGIDLRELPEGVVIREVVPESAAEKAKVQTDRIIKRVNGKKVTTPEEYYQFARQAGDKLVLTFDTDETVTLNLR